MNSISPRNSSLRAQFRAATETALLDAAEEVAAHDGIEAANLQAIAARAGVAVGTIYNYFADRETLFEALFERRCTELAKAVDETAARTADGPFEVQLREFVQNLFGFFEERRSFLRIVVDAEHLRIRPAAASDGRRAALAHLRVEAARLVARGVKLGRLRCDNGLYVDILVGMLRGVLVGRAAADGSLAEHADALVAMFLYGTSMTTAHGSRSNAIAAISDPVGSIAVSEEVDSESR